MTLQELKIELAKKGKTATWLAAQLGYSPVYLYNYVIKKQIKKELDRIKDILKEVR